MPSSIKQLGFQRPVIQKDHYVFGAADIPKVVLKKDGQWFECVPINEKQANDFFDTFGCTVFGTNNCIEILIRCILNTEKNNSDRFGYIVSKTFPPGNDPHVVAEAFREHGLIEEKFLPFSDDIDTLEKFVDLGPNKDALIDKGLEWKKTYDFRHQWIFADDVPLAEKQKRMIEYLMYSPLGVSVRAWQQRDNGLYYKEPFTEDTHWTVCIGYKLNEYWLIFDTYPQSDGSYIKKLEWDYDFGFAKRYYLALRPVEPKEPAQLKQSFWKRIYTWIINLLTKKQ